MNELKAFVENNDVDFTKNLITQEKLNKILTENKLVCGTQLQEYILSYGYLGFEACEFYGINSVQLEKSDMITQTEYLNKYFPKSHGFIALENRGEGDYAIIDSGDTVFILSTEQEGLKNTEKKLEQYILERFRNQ